MENRFYLMSFWVLPLLGYLAGSIPFGLIIGLLRGVDVRTLGSGNIGSTNVGRILGRPWGYLCFVLDVAKGFLPVWWAGHYLTTAVSNINSALPLSGQLAWLLTAAGCIVGHMFSIYLKFHGGKGVATSLGVLLGIWPYFTLTSVVSLLIWVGIWGLWRYVSLASITAAMSFPLAFLLLIWRIPRWSFNSLWPLFLFSCMMAGLVVLRHRSNISRLLAGTENRSGSAGRKGPATHDS